MCYKINANFFESINNEYNAYWLGFIIDILRKNKIIYRLKHYKENVYEIRITGASNIYAFFSYLYNDSNRFLERRYNKFLESFSHYDLP